MSEVAAAFAFLAGISAGFLIGIISAANITTNIDKKRVQSGQMTYKYRLFKVTEVQL